MDETAPAFDRDKTIHGHEIFTSALMQAAEQGRIAHAWLLTGPAGTGKGTMTRMAAAWLLSETHPQTASLIDEPPEFAIDINDPGANLVIRSAHPDLKIITPDLQDNKSGQIKIGQVRDLLGFMAHKPARDGWRVAIIDSLDDMNRNGHNALLKVLEEPPEKTILFLIASRPGRLPPTIRSRCRVVRIAPPTAGACSDILALTEQPESAISSTDLSRLAGGAPGRARQLLESGAVDCYMAACTLMAAETLDSAALGAICEKWGKGAAAGAQSRNGAAWLISRLLHMAAKQAATGQFDDACAFEASALARLVQKHSSAHLAERHAAFVRDASQADALYLDFAHFLHRQLTILHQKSLP